MLAARHCAAALLQPPHSRTSASPFETGYERSRLRLSGDFLRRPSSGLSRRQSLSLLVSTSLCARPLGSILPIELSL